MIVPERHPPPSGEVHLWWALVEDLKGRVSAGEALLSDTELARGRRFHSEGRRLEYLATRVLERTVLSGYAHVQPTDWRFRATDKGRPEIDHPPGLPPLRYNLANVDELVACVVAGDVEVGVDVERLDRPAALDAAERFFAASELAALRTLPREAQSRRFFDYWTLKESYLKARGLGLTLPLDQFAFELEGSDSARIAFDSRLADDPDWWEFRRLELTWRHLAAVAIRRPPGAQIALVVRRSFLSLDS